MGLQLSTSAGQRGGENIIFTQKRDQLGLMKNTAAALLLIVVVSSFAPVQTLKGTWQFAGGVYNGKREGATKKYALQRKYSDSQFDAFVVENGSKPEKYQSGYYILKGDSCIETETFCSQPYKLTGVP